MVGINYFGVSTHGMPFGGAKDSGCGREGGVEGIQNYTIAKTVSQVCY
jgi:succinate-semialdehyde dehydrogenase/glutarate-semialdehyde dehydrogenase